MHLIRMARFFCELCQEKKLHDVGRTMDGKINRCCILCGKMTEMEEEKAVLAKPQVKR